MLHHNFGKNLIIAADCLNYFSNQVEVSLMDCLFEIAHPFWGNLRLRVKRKYCINIRYFFGTRVEISDKSLNLRYLLMT